MTPSLGERWHEHWFRPASGDALAICRALFFVGVVYEYRKTEWGVWAELGATFWFPTPAFEALGLGYMTPNALQTLGTLWLACLSLAAIGLFTRISSALAAALGFYLIGLPHNFGKIHHSDALIVFVLFAMALSHCGAHGSVDAWLRRRLGRAPAPSASGEYRWPIAFVQLAWVIVYFAAGLAKLRIAGVQWVFSDSFRNILLEHHYTTHPPFDWGLAIAEHAWLCRILALGALLTEILSPLALFSARARAAFVPALFSMQLGIGLVLGVGFSSFLPIVAFWIPWDAGRSWLDRRRGSGTAAG